MLPDPSRIDTFWDIFGLVIVTVPATVAALAAWHNRKDIRTVRDQVQNGHVINFRDEVTTMATAVTRLSEKMALLHSDVHQERLERRESIRELRQDLTERLDSMSTVRSRAARDKARSEK